jgi:predicted transcriptional regulator
MRNLVAGVKEKEGFSKIKEKITGECEKLLAASGDKTRFEIVSDLFSKETSDDPAVNRSILGLLILHNHRNTGKKQLVDLWAKESKIAEDILFEMLDTCKTEDAINEYKKWLRTSKGMSYQEVHSIMQELDKDGISLQQSTGALVALG